MTRSFAGGTSLPEALLPLQVLEKWVAERDLEEVLKVMGEARVPSGVRSCPCHHISTVAARIYVTHHYQLAFVEI